jgi:putative phage-type endonuclease
MGKHLKNAVPLSPDWFNIRKTKGNITASGAGNNVGINSEDHQVKNIKDPVKRGQKQVLTAFRIAREPSENTFNGNWFTRRGNFHEPHCIEVFEAALGIKVQHSNMWQSEEYPWLFATPDGLIDEETGLEVKNPYNHLHTEPPPHYMAQMQIQMHCSNRKKTYFMSQCIKEDCARIWMVYYSPSFFNWLIEQLQYVHDTACDPSEKLDLSRFDFKPPFVPYELVKDIPSLTELVGEIEEFPEPPPPWLGVHARINKFGKKPRESEPAISQEIETYSGITRGDIEQDFGVVNKTRKIVHLQLCRKDIVKSFQ